MAKYTCTLGRSDCHQDIYYNNACPRFELTWQESIRTGLLLSQGGEFGFVVFSLANRLKVLPLELNKLLIIVVVLSMALTPLLNDFGRTTSDFLDEKLETKDTSLHLGSKLLKGLGILSDEVNFLSNIVRDSMKLQAQEALSRDVNRKFGVMKPIQVRVTELMSSKTTSSSIPLRKGMQEQNQEQPETPYISTIDNIEPSDIRDKSGLTYPKSTTDVSEDVEDGKGVTYCELDDDASNKDKSLEENNIPTTVDQS